MSIKREVQKRTERNTIYILIHGDLHMSHIGGEDCSFMEKFWIVLLPLVCGIEL